MDEKELIINWNIGNYEYIIENFNFNTFSNFFSVFFYLDSFFQLQYFEKIEELVNNFYNQSSKNIHAKKIKNLFLSKLYSRMGDHERSLKLIKDIDAKDFNLNDWIDFNIKQQEALTLFIKNDYNTGLQCLLDIEKNLPNFIQVFENYNTSYFYTIKMLIEWKLGEHQNALKSTKRSEEINRLFKNEFKLAYDYFVRGQIRVELGELLKGLVDFEEANILYRKFNNKYGKELVLLAIAEVKYIQGKLSESLAMFERSVQQFQGQDYQLCDIYYLIGKIYQKKNELGKAKENFIRSIEIATKLKINFYQSLAIVTMIDLLIQKGDINEISHYKKLFVNQTDDENVKLMRLMMEALIYESKKKYKESKDLWILISNNRTLPLALQIYTLENGLKSCIMIWKKEKDIILLNEIQEIIEKWEKLATDNVLMSSLATIYLLKAKFYLAVIQIEPAKFYLQQGKKIAQKYGLEIDNEEIKKDELKISTLEQLNIDITSEKKDDIKLEDILDYLKKVKTNLRIEK